MSLSRSAHTTRALARAMFVVAALAATLQSPGVQGAMGGAAPGDLERSAAQRSLHRRAEQARHARAELFRGMEREQAHAQMPDTLYASTPVPLPPHPFLLDSGTEPGRERSAAREPARSAEGLGYRVGLFPAASRSAQEDGYQGFVRVVNRSDEEGEARIGAWDDEGNPVGPVTLPIEANETKHFNSDDLEMGNTDKGLDGTTGPGEGDWRIVLSSPLELQVLAYLMMDYRYLNL